MESKSKILIVTVLGSMPIPMIAADGMPAGKNEHRSNILLIVCDDLRPEIGCYGNPHMITPNMDALAKEGVIFQRAYVQQAVSAASRASFLTGCRPDITGVDYPYSEYFVNEFLPAHPSIQKYMYDNGFYTRTFGKIHHGRTENFSERHFAATKPRAHIDLSKINSENKLPIYEALNVPDTAYADGQQAAEAVRTIHNLKKNNAEGKPFFLSVGFYKPHVAFCAPKKYFDLYDRDKIPVSPNPERTVGECKLSVHPLSTFRNFSGERDEGHIVSEARQRQIRQAYFACVSYVDAQLGKIIEALKEENLYDDTAIILIGDHGWHLGDNGCWGKGTNFERSTRAPFIVRIPDKNAAKNRNSFSLIEFVDLYPTICELGGVKVPEYIEGTSVVPLLYNPDLKWKRAAFSQFPRGKEYEGYTVRTDRYRYVEWVENKTGDIIWKELYDHKTDSIEAFNVACSRQRITKQMKNILHDGWKKALPKGIVNKSNNKIAPIAEAWGPEARHHNSIELNEKIKEKILIDKNATRETKNLYQKLSDMTYRNSGMLFGHHLSNYKGYDWIGADTTKARSDVYSAIGDFPVVFGYDFEAGFAELLPAVRQAAEMGGIITICYHMRTPNNILYYKRDGIIDKNTDKVSSFLSGGKNHAYLKEQLDSIADFASKAKIYDKKIPIIFRPWHENTGEWFWWGSDNSTSEQFIELWRFTVSYLRDVKGVDNFIYAYSPSRPMDFGGYENRNPGSEWFDIAGFDCYFTSDDYSDNFLKQAEETIHYAKEHNKIAACTEFGYKKGLKNTKRTDWFTKCFLEPLVEKGFQSDLAYCLTWGVGWIPKQGTPLCKDFNEFRNNHNVYFLSEYNFKLIK